MIAKSRGTIERRNGAIFLAFFFGYKHSSTAASKGSREMKYSVLFNTIQALYLFLIDRGDVQYRNDVMTEN